MRNPLLLTVLVSASLAAPALAEPWDAVLTRGNGVLMETRIPLPAYHSVVVKAPLDVEISEGPSDGAHAFLDSNLSGRLRMDVDQGVLTITLAGKSVNLHDRARVLLRVPTLKSVRVEGSSDVEVKPRKVEVDALELRSSGSGEIDWQGGNAGDLTVAIGGSGDLKLKSRAKRAAVETTGSGDLALDLDVRGPLSIEQGGSGDVLLRGNVEVLAAKSQGSGSLTLRGSASKFSMQIGGSGDLDAAKFPAREVAVETTGSGDAKVSVRNGPLSAKTHGSGDIDWSGSATKTQIEAKGSGKVTQVDG